MLRNRDTRLVFAGPTGKGSEGVVATQGRITDERLEWVAERFNGVVGNIETAIQGKREGVELIVLALLS